MPENPQIPLTSVHHVEADEVTVFDRRSGLADAPVVLLPHGFPTSSFQYRELIPRLADRYRVITPDLPGFGFTVVPQERQYRYTFDSLAETVLAFTDALNLQKYAMYVFDYGAPTGLRIAMRRPERVTAIVSQNGNACEEGLGDAWAPSQRYWRSPTAGNREPFVRRWTRRGCVLTIRRAFRTLPDFTGHRGIPPGQSNAAVQLLETGHFAPETLVEEAASAMRAFLSQRLTK